MTYTYRNSDTVQYLNTIQNPNSISIITWWHGEATNEK